MNTYSFILVYYDIWGCCSKFIKLLSFESPGFAKEGDLGLGGAGGTVLGFYWGTEA